MSFVWSKERVESYLACYRDIRTHHSYGYASFAVSRDYARSVLPPCLEPADHPTVTISFGAFIEWIGGVANRYSMDRAASVGINARYGGEEGSYHLAVVEEDEVNINTGRELWGMAKKQGRVDFFNDGRAFYGLCARRGIRLIEMQATLGDVVETRPEDESGLMFELRGQFGPNGQGLTGAQLVIFENGTLTHNHRNLTGVRVALGQSPHDTGYADIPLGECTGAALVGGETSYIIREAIALDGDSHDYAPYLLGRLYDDWSDVRVQEGRVVA